MKVCRYCYFFVSNFQCSFQFFFARSVVHLTCQIPGDRTFLCLSGEPFSLETNLSAVVSCFNNVGPGLGAVGPAGSYAGYSVLSKLLLSAAMLMGRLEIYPMLVALSPSVWRKD